MEIADDQLSSEAASSVTALYAEHALGLVRLAVVMTGDRNYAEDIVQEAFLGLYRRWGRLPDTSAPLAYVRVSVLNGCRTTLRRRARLGPLSPLRETADGAGQHAESAEARALLSEEQRAVATALRNLPRRQREALVLRYYLDLPDSEIAAAMSVGESTVRSTVHRGLANLGRVLSKELS